MGCRRGGGAGTALGRCARTAATFWVFLTLGTSAFFARVTIVFDFSLERVERLAAIFFFAVAVGRFGVGFLPRTSDLEAADLDPLRASDFDGVALLA